jgi:hypothetical protein
MTIQDDTIQHIAITRIKRNPHNTRTHPAKQIRQIADNIIAVGFRNPVLVNEEDELLAGHGRLDAAELLGLETVPAIVIAGLSPAKQRVLAIADNKIAENAGWDRERLAIEIPEVAELLAAEGLDISLLGFEPIEIERLEPAFEPAAPSRRRNGIDPDGIDPRWGEAPIVSRTGDLWELGEHRLLCGDACSAGDLLRLMSGRRADAAFLDPPHDSMTWRTGTTVPGVLTCALETAAAVTRDGGAHFVCADWPHLAALMAAARPVYGEPIDSAVWVKSGARSGALYRGQHEFIAVFAVECGSRLDGVRHSKRPRASVWHHPAVTWPRAIRELQLQSLGKPVALIADAIKDTTRRGGIVLDTFAGAGTTILAAERVKRQARALEAKPRLVDIAIRRWQTATRGIARHADSGLSFDEIAARGRQSAHALARAGNQGEGR